ncbi:MAG TPA: HGGxSTG domain-containing protein [Candidatus Angelobacter sp.]|nr:HGGxSTG domain-containing protein [Candidatus Angelobacter sp.]
MTNGRCRLHGGKSTGARTADGQRRAATARLVHGRRTAAVIGARSAAATVGRRLAWMTEFARDLSAGHGVHRSDPPPPLGDARMRARRSAPATLPRSIRRKRQGMDTYPC